jgi:hypothetical protein
LFGPLTLAQTDARAAAVLVDEFDVGPFESLSQNNQSCTSRFSYASLYPPTYARWGNANVAECPLFP